VSVYRSVWRVTHHRLCVTKLTHEIKREVNLLNELGHCATRGIDKRKRTNCRPKANHTRWSHPGLNPVNSVQLVQCGHRWKLSSVVTPEPASRIRSPASRRQGAGGIRTIVNGAPSSVDIRIDEHPVLGDPERKRLSEGQYTACLLQPIPVLTLVAS